MQNSEKNLDNPEKPTSLLVRELVGMARKARESGDLGGAQTVLQQARYKLAEGKQGDAEQDPPAERLEFFDCVSRLHWEFSSIFAERAASTSDRVKKEAYIGFACTHLGEAMAADHVVFETERELEQASAA